MIVSLILFVLILGVVVLVHEFGHFIFAKIFKVKVFEFSIGMGPKLAQRTAKDGTKYSIRWIPIGGYVSLAGEDPDDVNDCEKGERLPDKPVWQRLIIMIMGVVNNFLFAFLILFISGLIYGSENMSPIVSDIMDDYPASLVGMSSGDRILAINGRKVTYVDDISLYLAVEDLSNDIKIDVQKENGDYKSYLLKAKVITDNDGDDTYVVGLRFSNKVEHGFMNAIVFAYNKTLSIFNQMFVVLGGLFTGGVSVKDLSGPVGIYTVVDKAKTYGFNNILYLVALLCINVGVINILPFPAFDGGRVFLLIIEKIIRRPVPAKIENIINTIGFVLIFILMIYVTFNDILRLF